MTDCGIIHYRDHFTTDSQLSKYYTIQPSAGAIVSSWARSHTACNSYHSPAEAMQGVTMSYNGRMKKWRGYVINDDWHIEKLQLLMTTYKPLSRKRTPHQRRKVILGFPRLADDGTDAGTVTNPTFSAPVRTAAIVKATLSCNATAFLRPLTGHA